MTFPQVFSDILTFELSKTSLNPSEQAQMVEGVAKYADPTNSVYKIFKRRTTNYWTRTFEQVAIDPNAAQQFQGGAVIIPRIIKAAQLARLVFDKNLLVHRARYSCHIIQAAIDLA